MAVNVNVKGVIHFMDGTKIVLQWPRQAGADPATIAANVKKALESDRIAVEVTGHLLIIPVRNIKYIQVTPSPEKLPQGVIRGARVVE